MVASLEVDIEAPAGEILDTGSLGRYPFFCISNASRCAISSDDFRPRDTQGLSPYRVQSSRTALSAMRRTALKKCVT